MPAPHPSLNTAACVFASRHGLCGIDGAEIFSVRDLELTLAALPRGTRMRQRWRTLCSRYRKRRGERSAPYVRRRATAVDTWLATFGFASGDAIDALSALIMQRELDRTWFRYNGPACPPNSRVAMWRRRAGAEWAIALTPRTDGRYDVDVRRLVQRRSVTDFVTMGTNRDQRRTTNRSRANKCTAAATRRKSCNA